MKNPTEKNNMELLRYQKFFQRNGFVVVLCYFNLCKQVRGWKGEVVLINFSLSFVVVAFSSPLLFVIPIRWSAVLSAKRIKRGDGKCTKTKF